MKLIPLTQGQFAVVDDKDYESLMQHKWHASKQPRGFVAVRKIGPANDRYTLYMHREILDAPIKTEVDHINRNTLDNRRCNIRTVTSSENKMNIGKRRYRYKTTSEYVGVDWHSPMRAFRARINKDGVSHLAGYYETEQEAALARDEMGKKLYGDCYSPNFGG